MVDILHRVGIKASPDAVWQALGTREGVAAWWTDSVQGESKVGSVLRFGFFDKAGKELGSFHMKVLELLPDERVLWQVVDGAAEWIGTRIGFDLKRDGDHTIVLFKHAGWAAPVEFMHHCSTKWAIFLMSLKSLLETGRGSPSPDDIKIDNWN